MDTGSSGDKNEKELVGRIRRGDESAFRLFVDQYKDKISGYVYRLIKNDADREEVCQDVFVKVYSNIKDFRFESSLSTWLYRIAWHTAISHIRSNKKRLETIEYDEMGRITDAFEASDQTPGEALGDQQLFDKVNEQIEKLLVEEKNILTLYHFLGLTIGEISQITLKPAGTIKSDLFRIRKKLKNQIQSSIGVTSFPLEQERQTV